MRRIPLVIYNKNKAKNDPHYVFVKNPRKWAGSLDLHYDSFLEIYKGVGYVKREDLEGIIEYPVISLSNENYNYYTWNE